MALNSKIKNIALTILVGIVAITVGGGFAVYKIRTWKNSSQQQIGSWNTIGKDKDVNSDDLLSADQERINLPECQYG
jgi:hypothetical protein